MSPTGSVAQKWPGNLLDAGFVPVSRIFLRNYFRLEPKLSDFEALFLINLVDYVWSDRRAFPGWQRLSEDLGIPVSRVTDTLEELQMKGFISFVSVKDNKGRAYSLEQFYLKLEELIKSGKAWTGKDSSGARNAPTDDTTSTEIEY